MSSRARTAYECRFSEAFEKAGHCPHRWFFIDAVVVALLFEASQEHSARDGIARNNDVPFHLQSNFRYHRYLA